MYPNAKPNDFRRAARDARNPNAKPNDFRRAARDARRHSVQRKADRQPRRTANRFAVLSDATDADSYHPEVPVATCREASR